MTIWVLFSLVAVVIVKYYTSMQMRSLEQRLNVAREEAHKAKEKLLEAQKQLDEAKAQEDLYEQRIRSMNEMIQDINIRLTAGEQSKEELIAEEIRAG